MEWIAQPGSMCTCCKHVVPPVPKPTSLSRHRSSPAHHCACRTAARVTSASPCLPAAAHPTHCQGPFNGARRLVVDRTDTLGLSAVRVLLQELMVSLPVAVGPIHILR